MQAVYCGVYNTRLIMSLNDSFTFVLVTRIMTSKLNKHRTVLNSNNNNNGNKIYTASLNRNFRGAGGRSYHCSVKDQKE